MGRMGIGSDGDAEAFEDYERRHAPRVFEIANRNASANVRPYGPALATADRLRRATSRNLKRALKAPPLESKLEGAAVAHAAARDCLHYKMNGAGRRGKVDHAFALPGGRTWWVEFKRKDETARRQQRLDHDALILRGHRVDVIDDLGTFKKRLALIVRGKL